MHHIGHKSCKILCKLEEYLGIKITSKTNWKQKGITNLAIFVQNGRILGIKIPSKKNKLEVKGTYLQFQQAN
jgi:hypothetical protein